jgi:hypothetical protein
MRPAAVRSFCRTAVLLLALAGLAACTAADPDAQRPPLGDFSLGYTIVVDKNAQLAPFSRKVEPGVWEASLKREIERRFSPYEGPRLYHLGINVDAYALAVPGVPLVVSPKSVLVISANVWDDARGIKLHEKPKQITVFEQLSGETLVGSGLTQTKEQQMANLTANAVRAIEAWLVENKEAWFGTIDAPLPAGFAPRPVAVAPAGPVPVPAAPLPARPAN